MNKEIIQCDICKRRIQLSLYKKLYQNCILKDSYGDEIDYACIACDEGHMYLVGDSEVRE